MHGHADVLVLIDIVNIFSGGRRFLALGLNAAPE